MLVIRYLHYHIFVTTHQRSAQLKGTTAACNHSLLGTAMPPLPATSTVASVAANNSASASKSWSMSCTVFHTCGAIRTAVPRMLTCTPRSNSAEASCCSCWGLKRSSPSRTPSTMLVGCQTQEQAAPHHKSTTTITNTVNNGQRPIVSDALH